MLIIDTDEVPIGRRREAYLLAAAGESGSSTTEIEAPEDAVRIRLETWRFGPITLFATHGNGMRMVRTARQARADSLDTVSVITQPQGEAWYAWSGGQRRFGPAGLALVHRQGGYEYRSTGTGLSVAFMADTDRLGLPEHLVREAIPTAAGSPVAGLLLGHLRDLHRDADRLAELPGAESVGQAVLDLTRALVASVAPDRIRRGVAEETLLTRVLAYARANLADPDLTARRIAHVHNISLRSLYRLCEDGGLSLEQWIIRRRLDEVRRALAAPEHAHRTIEAIARAWGFPNAPYFTRRFRQAYGETPGTWRRRATDRGLAGPR
ncbi:AraC-like DNA-binding protein [Actinocorallia herbida]|uniref:AraC-like DNA-binding protein n=1 Tax=Actinocorallia herbida TaxID=58109 RepID=A0A3N1CX69_9ACTN|nr:helix-turn-helix domain-containing protein [Actinocorallia herbida]ROO85864.1 AraC-like DNA-binding protein [Actinocorallia herbida]